MPNLVLALCLYVAAASPVYLYPFDGSNSTGWIEEKHNTSSGEVTTNAAGTKLTLKQNERIYMVSNGDSAKGDSDWPSNQYLKLNLLGKTLSWTQDVSKVECGCNAALYLTAMSSPTSDSSGYCDIQPDGGGCVEIDLFEGNTKALQTTVHTETGTGCGACNEWGCMVNYGFNGDDSFYGTSASSTIDSSRAFQVSAAFSEAGSMTLELTQDGKSHKVYDKTLGATCEVAGVPDSADAKVKSTMESGGMVLMASLWTSDDNLYWLNGGARAGPRSVTAAGAGILTTRTDLLLCASLRAGCSTQYPLCSLESAEIVFTNITVSEDGPPDVDDTTNDDGPGTDDSCAEAYAQCGGKGWTGPTCCVDGYECHASGGEYYSQCTPTSTAKK